MRRRLAYKDYQAYTLSNIMKWFLPYMWSDIKTPYISKKLFYFCVLELILFALNSRPNHHQKKVVIYF